MTKPAADGMATILLEEAWLAERLVNHFRTAIWILAGVLTIFLDWRALGEVPMSAMVILGWGCATGVYGAVRLKHGYTHLDSLLLTFVDITILMVHKDAVYREFLNVHHDGSFHRLYSAALPLMVILGSNVLRYSVLDSLGSLIYGVLSYGALLHRHGAVDASLIMDVFLLSALSMFAVYMVSRQKVVIFRVRQRDAMLRFLPGPMVDSLGSNPLDFSLGGAEIEAVVLFADIRGFTALASNMNPTQVVEFLNDYFTLMVEVIFDHSGILDKFIGDGLCAVFVPKKGLELPAKRALRAALGMRLALVRLNQERRARGEPDLRIGIGIHTGPVLAGRIGSVQRMEYTHIGNTMNVASRVEGLCKELGEDLLVSRETFEQAGGATCFIARALPPARVRGRDEILEVLALDGEEKS